MEYYTIIKNVHWVQLMTWETVPVIIIVLSNKRKFWKCVYISKYITLLKYVKTEYMFIIEIYIDNIPMSIIYTIYVYYMYIHGIHVFMYT